MLEFDCAVRRGAFLLTAQLALPTPGLSVLFGRSGAGKSTLVATLAGLLRPLNGRIALDGEVLFDSATGIDLPPERRAIGYLFQDGRLFPHYDVRGNLRYGLRRVRDRALRVPLDGVISLLGLESLLGRRIFELSGGERQRVALGRALLAQPRLLLLDEPLASVDRARKEEVLPYVERLRDELGLPIVYVSHDFEELLRLAQHVVVLEGGGVVAQAPVQEICRAAPLNAILGAGIVGTVLEGVVVRRDQASGLCIVRCGDSELYVAHGSLEEGAQVRLHLAADDIAVARERPTAVSIRNVLPAQVERLEPEQGAELLHLVIGNIRLIARVTESAARELELRAGTPCFALFKALAVKGHVLRRGAGL